MVHDPALVIQDEAEFITAPKYRVLLYVATEDGRFLPVTPELLAAGGGTGSGGGNDLASAREVTLGQVRDRLPARLIPLGDHLTLPLDGTAKQVPWPTGTLGARIGISGGGARVAVSTPAPTATAGLLWGDGSTWELGQGDIAGFRAILASGSPVLDVQPLGAG